MSSLQEPPSSPPDASSTSPEALLAYYKSNYEQLELELADFQASSRELETELEKDVEAAEKRERKLREKVESLGYEVEEWKTKCKQAKAEANTAQNTLQREITGLRDSNRTMQLKLRDIEVANDDFERQARNTTSSLEDLESKYNVAIERAVMLEAEMQSGDQEREALRIDSQRLRDELSDLKIEAEITQGKLRHQEEAAHRERGQHLRPSSQALSGSNRPQSPASSDSPSMMTATSSPSICTPPRPKSASTDTTSEVPTPPSPTSEKSSAVSILAITTPSHPLKPATTDDADTNTTPRPTHFPRVSHVPPRHSRTSSIQPISASYPVNPRTPSTLQPRIKPQSRNPGRAGVPQSSSLRQIRGLIGQVAKLEQRVHSARSRLPAPVHTPPHASPRNDSALGHHSHLPAGVTVRSHKKRATGSITSRSSSAHEPVEHASSYSTRPVSRLSFGMVPHSASVATDRTGSRPSSRASISSRTSIGPSTSTGANYQRPSSRASLSGARTPLGHHTSSLSLSGAAADSRRPRSSISGSYGTLSSQSTNGVGPDDHSRPSRTTTTTTTAATTTTKTPIGRRSLLTKSDLDLTMTTSSIPTPKRMSGGAALFLNNASLSLSHNDDRKGYGAISGTAGSAPSATRRTSSGMSVRKDPAAYGGGDSGEMGPPERRKRLSGVGETF